MAREKPTYRAELERLDAAFPDKEFLTAKELADYLGVCRQTIYRKWHDHFNETIHGFTKARIASVLASYMKLPEGKEVPTNQRCIRNGVRCGHRRPTNDGNYSSSLMCHYMLDTGHQRNCPAGNECIHYTDEKCRNMDNWSINGNPLNFESLSKIPPRPGARLRAIRRAHKDSQRALGEVMGVAQNTIAAWEAGRSEMPTGAVLKVCEKYNISSEWLLGLSNKFKEENKNEKRNNQGQD